MDHITLINVIYIFDGYISYMHVYFCHIRLVCFMCMNVLLSRGRKRVQYEREWHHFIAETGKCLKYCENICELVSTVSEHTPRYVVRTCSFPGVHL